MNCSCFSSYSTNKKISKSQRLTNWQSPNLSLAQQTYAAVDAWACMDVYNVIKENNNNADVRKKLVFDEGTKPELLVAEGMKRSELEITAAIRRKTSRLGKREE